MNFKKVYKYLTIYSILQGLYSTNFFVFLIVPLLLNCEVFSSKKWPSNQAARVALCTAFSQNSLIYNYSYEIQKIAYRNNKLLIEVQKLGKNIKVQDSKVYESEDEGLTWTTTSLSSIPALVEPTLKNGSGKIPYGLYSTAHFILDENTAWAITVESEKVNSEYKSYIHKTSDGGTSWSKVHSLLATQSQFLYAFDSQNVLAIFWSNSNLKAFLSSDGGATWLNNDFFFSGYTLSFKSIFPNAQVGFLYYNTRLFRTLDSGVKWEQLTNLPNAQNNILGLDFKNGTTGFISFENKLYKTSDSGNNWSLIREESTNEQYSFGNPVYYYLTCYYQN